MTHGMSGRISYSAPMYIDIVPNRKSPPAILLSESVRDGKHVRKRTIANLSALPIAQAEMIRRVLKGERLGPVESALEVTRSLAHGHVEAVRMAMKRLGFDKLIDAKASRERDLVAGRIIAPEASELDKVKAMVMAGRLAGRDKIGVRIGKVIGKYKVAKHFDLDIQDGAFGFAINDQRVSAEAALDGLYVIRTSVSASDMRVEAAVLNYKKLAGVERAFRTLKGVDLHVRPIRHRLEGRVKAHIFLSMLAYYVQWHMLQAWAPLTFKDEAEAGVSRERDPVAPAKRSPAALDKVHTRTLADGTPAFGFTRLLGHLATVVRNTLRPAGAKAGEATFDLTTRPNPKQQQALDLKAAIPV